MRPRHLVLCFCPFFSSFLCRFTTTTRTFYRTAPSWGSRSTRRGRAVKQPGNQVVNIFLRLRRSNPPRRCCCNLLQILVQMFHLTEMEAHAPPPHRLPSSADSCLTPSLSTLVASSAHSASPALLVSLPGGSPAATTSCIAFDRVCDSFNLLLHGARSERVARREGRPHYAAAKHLPRRNDKARSQFPNHHQHCVLSRSLPIPTDGYLSEYGKRFRQRDDLVAGMTSQGVNVLRWGALVLGVFYGFSHQSTINSRDRAAALQHQWDRKAKLIDEAKAEYRKKMISAESKPASGGSKSSSLPIETL